jgi:hypothetical protein
MLQKIQALFEKVVDRIEGNPAPASRYFILFFAILAVRLALEFFSTQRLFTLDDVTHIGLWFAFIVLAFMLQLSLFSGVAMQRVAKLVVVSFTIALTAPIIDLILRGGVGAKMNYLAINSWHDVLYAYFTVGGASLSRGATLGIRIEIVLLVFASFNYLRIKTKNLFRAIIGTLFIYTVLFLSGTIPRLLGAIVDGLQLTYQPDDQSTVLFLLSLDLLLVFFILMRHSKDWMREIFTRIPWGAALLAVGSFAIGMGLAMKAYPGNWTLNPTTLFWFPLFLVLGLALGAYAGMYKLPEAKGPRKNQAASFKKDPQKTGNLIRTGLMILIVGTGLAISERVFFGGMVVWGLIFLLNEAPLELRKVPILRNLIEVLILFGAALIGFAAFGGPMIGFPKAWIVVLLGAATVGSFSLDALRMGDSCILWYRDWLSGWQRIFRVFTSILRIGSSLFVAWVLGLEVFEYFVLCGLSALPEFAIWLKIKRMQVALLSLLPLWAYLVSQVFLHN